MAKKQNQAERVFAMLDKEKVKCHITENTLFPAVLLGGTKTGNEERMKYRCAHCRHEWEKVYPNLYSRHNRVLICPNCQKPMFPGLRIPVDSIHRSGTLQLRSGTQLKNFRYVLYVDAATLDDTQGLIISEYEPTIVYHYSDVPESFEVELKMGHYGFVSPSHKILFNEDLSALMRASVRDHKSLRIFWSDVIMLNLITNKLLKQADPKTIEKILSPVPDGVGREKQ